MRTMIRPVATLVAALLLIGGFLWGYGSQSAQAAEKSSVVVPTMDLKSMYLGTQNGNDQLSVRRASELSAKVWCNASYDAATRPADEQVTFMPMDAPVLAAYKGFPYTAHPGWPAIVNDALDFDPAPIAAYIAVDVPKDQATVAQVVQLPIGTCGYTRFWISGAANQFDQAGAESRLASDGLSLTFQIDPFDHFGGGGLIFGETPSGGLEPVYLMTLTLDRPTVVPPVLPPAAAPDAGRVPVGTAKISVPVLANDDLPNGISALAVVVQPSNGSATVLGTSEADFQVTVDGQVIVVPPTSTPTPTAIPSPTSTPAATPTPVPFKASTGAEASSLGQRDVIMMLVVTVAGSVFLLTGLVVSLLYMARRSAGR